MNPIKCFALSLILLTLCPVLRAAESKEQRDARMQWWRDAHFGLFIHWGLYAIPAGEWNGKKVGGGGEWVLNQAHIPLADYEKLKSQFNPEKFDAKEWVRIAHDAGMKYIVITSKHHDGFCLWPSKLSADWTVAQTPFKRDILKELSDACKADGTVRFCVYYSIMDWHHPDAQAKNAPNYNPPRNDPNYKPNPNFQRYIDDYMKPQLKELIENYDPGVIWFDGEWVSDYTDAMGRDVFDYCRSLNPKIILNNRVSKSRKGMAGLSADKDAPGDFGTPEQQIPATGLPGVDWESCMTMNGTWGYKKDDNNWKSARTLIRNLVDVVGKGGNYLLNVGPTAEGEIPAESVQRLEQIGQWIKANPDWNRAAPGKPHVIIPLRQAGDGTLSLFAADADVHAANAKLEKKGSNPYNIGYWTNANDTVSWDATVDKPGAFSVDLEYSLAPNSKGAEISIDFGNSKSIPVKLEAGKDFLDFKTVNVGQVELGAGPVSITVKPTKKPGLAVMDLRRIELKPAR
jgi:alpha-L-fucosidase